MSEQHCFVPIVMLCGTLCCCSVPPGLFYNSVGGVWKLPLLSHEISVKEGTCQGAAGCSILVKLRVHVKNK